MNYDMLVDMIGQYGYAALFFALWLGIVGIPIPDEVIVMTGGAATSSGLLHVVPAFFLTYLGVISGLSLGYFLGRFVGPPILEKLRRKKNLGKYIAISENLVAKYGSMALVICYFFPVVRHITPYIVGVNKMTFRRYALISFTTGFVWTMTFFVLGRLAGKHVEEIGMMVYQYGLKLLWIPVVVAVLWVGAKMMMRRKSSSAG